MPNLPAIALSKDVNRRAREVAIQARDLMMRVELEDDHRTRGVALMLATVQRVCVEDEPAEPFGT